MRRLQDECLTKRTLVAVIAMCYASALMAAENRLPSLTVKDVQQRLRATNSRINSWYVEYEEPRKLSTGTATGYMHRVVAAKAPDQFFHWSTHGYPSADWREDMFQQRLKISSASVVIERPAHRVFRFLSLPPHDPLPGSMPNEFLFYALGWWPFPDRPSPMVGRNGDVPAVLPGIASSRNYVVKPQLEQIQGRWCHILEYPVHDKLWLDCDRGCAILAREFFDSETGVLRQRIESSEHRELRSGIWVPFEFRNMLFDAAKSGPLKGEAVKIMDGVMQVRECRLNENVDDELFQFKPLPGSIETFDDNHTEQRVSGGLDYLGEMTSWVKKRVDVSAILSGDAGSATEAVIEVSIIGGGICAVIVGFLYHLIKGSGTRKIVPRKDVRLEA